MRRAGIALVLVVIALAVAWWMGIGAGGPPPHRAPACMRVEELARAAPNTRARCCELCGLNHAVGGRGDWEQGVRMPTGDLRPACPCGCAEGAACADLHPFDATTSRRYTDIQRLPPLAAEGVGFCHGSAEGHCSLSPGRAPGPSPDPVPRIASPGEDGCVPLKTAIERAEGSLVRICEWIGNVERFGGQGDWEVALVFPDRDRARWQKGERPACPCGCKLGAACPRLDGGEGALVYCRGASLPGCPLGTRVALGDDTPTIDASAAARQRPK